MVNRIFPEKEIFSDDRLRKSFKRNKLLHVTEQLHKNYRPYTWYITYYIVYVIDTGKT